MSHSMTPTPTPTCDVLVIAASNGQNLLLAERFAAAAREQGQSAEVVSNTTQPAKDDSIADLISRLNHLRIP